MLSLLNEKQLKRINELYQAIIDLVEEDYPMQAGSRASKAYEEALAWFGRERR